jgi:hypothetical protein
MTITWKVEELDRELADGYVYQVHYSVNGDDGTYTSRAVGSLPFDKPDTLIAFKDLTEETIIGWVKTKLTAENADAITNVETAINNVITEQKTPTKGKGLPW